MNTISINQKKFEFPAKWSEVLPSDFLKFAPKLFSEITEEVFFAFLLAYIPKKLLLKASAEQLHIISQPLHWLFEPQLQVDLLPNFQFKGQTYWSGGKALQRVSFDEYAHLDTYLHYYTQTENPVYLQKIVALLYRPLGKNENTYDKRAAIRYDELDSQAQKMAQLPEWQQKCIYFYLVNCKYFLVHTYKSLFPSAQPDESGNLPKPSPPDWNYIAVSMCAGDATKIKLIEAMPIQTALEFLVKQKKINKESEK